MAGTQSLRIALSGRRLLGGSAAAVAAGVLLAACGGTATVAKATPSPTAKASRAAFSGAAGTVASVSGADFTVDQTKGGAVTVDTTAKTKFTQEVSLADSDLAVGQCARAIGSTNSIGVVAATTITISTPTAAGCTVSFAGFGGSHKKFPRPSGSARPSFPGAGAAGAPAFQGAFGKIAAMTAGSQGAITLEVQGTSGQTSVTVSAATKILQEASAALDDVTPGKCAVAIGAKAKTAIVTAESVSLSVPGPSGCSAGFGGLAGGFGGAPGAGGSFGSAG